MRGRTRCRYWRGRCLRRRRGCCRRCRHGRRGRFNRRLRCRLCCRLRGRGPHGCFNRCLLGLLCRGSGLVGARRERDFLSAIWADFEILLNFFSAFYTKNHTITSISLSTAAAGLAFPARAVFALPTAVARRAVYPISSSRAVSRDRLSARAVTALADVRAVADIA